LFLTLSIDEHSRLLRVQKSNANQQRNDSEMKEISAQKLCAGTVSGATHRAGGLYWRLPVLGDAWACEAANWYCLVGCRGDEIAITFCSAQTTLYSSLRPLAQESPFTKKYNPTFLWLQVKIPGKARGFLQTNGGGISGARGGA
jgi:hypothetical protein